MCCFILIQCKEQEPVISIPAIKQLETTGVILTWQCHHDKAVGIYYKQVGQSSQVKKVDALIDENQEQTVYLKDLEPATQYMYWIEGSSVKYFFRTKSDKNAPFSFLLTDGSGSMDYRSTLKTEMYSFIVRFADQQSDELDACTPYVPIYELASMKQHLNWCGFSMVVIPQQETLSSALDQDFQASHSIGVFTSLKQGTDSLLLASSELHSKLVRFNQQSGSTDVVMVGLTNSQMPRTVIDGICYFGLVHESSTDKKAGCNVLLQVDEESIIAYWPALDEELLIREPPLQAKRTCQQCRRLADKGAFEASVKAYKQFIQVNQEHYQVDDAYLAIAELLDAKLFKYKQALEWYKRLLHDFPASSLTAIAKQRVAFISRYSSDGYKPLAAFERIKNNDYLKASNNPGEQQRVLEKLASVVQQYPQSSLKPVMLLWMANQYQFINVEKAIATYQQLIRQQPDFSKAMRIPLKIGETFYNNARWQEAHEAFSSSMDTYPELKETIQAQLARSNRNMRRILLFYVSLGGLLLIFLFLTFLSPKGVMLPPRRHVIIMLIVNFVIIFSYAWMYREEFASLSGLLLMVLAFIASIFLCVLAACTLDYKLRNWNQPFKFILSTLIGVIILASGFYQSIYHLYVHYLAALGL